MRSFSMTDKGKTREMNQDYVFTSDTPVGNLPNLFIVADGMGGHNAGDYASRYAVEVIVREITESSLQEPAAIFKHAIEQANQELVVRASQDIDLEGMGTTAVLATIIEDQLWVANVGDSRLYVLNEEIIQITRDHSLVEEMIRRGDLEPEQARLHPDKNIITRAIGATEDVDVDIFERKMTEKDVVLMCSDGLTNMVEDQELLLIGMSRKDIGERVKKLVDYANENGGKDNITAILIEPYADEVERC